MSPEAVGRMKLGGARGVQGPGDSAHSPAAHKFEFRNLCYQEQHAAFTAGGLASALEESTQAGALPTCGRP